MKIVDPFYLSAAWRAVRLQALQRCGWICQNPRCRKNLRLEPKPQVHHVIARTLRPDLALAVTNLRCLCLGCHNNEHDRVNGGDRPTYGADGMPKGSDWST